jgi:hypothetical protein
VQGDAFRASPRSQQFLRYVVDKAIHGDFDSLKERVIGVELFHRPPSFDTGEDSIVRVTASDVRKRLLQHYGRYGDGAEVRLAIPSGSYIPEITWSPHPESHPKAAAFAQAPSSEELKPHPIPQVAGPQVQPAPSIPPQPRFWMFAIPIVLVFSAMSFWLGVRTHRPDTTGAQALALPWSALLRPGHTLQIVDSDPDFAGDQDITHHSATLSDYANGRYIPEASPISPELRSFAQKYLQGNDIPAIDLPIATRIEALARQASKEVRIRSSRSLRLSDFHTDDDFVLLGSPLSNPWSDLFTDQLDFRFKYVNDSSLQAIENIHPQSNELSLYSPEGSGFLLSGPATGTSYGILAVVANPNQSGQVLLLAGTGAESTEAAGHLATNFSDLAAALKKCPASPDGTPLHFEILLRIRQMAGSPSSSEVMACHTLSGNTRPSK